MAKKSKKNTLNNTLTKISSGMLVTGAVTYIGADTALNTKKLRWKKKKEAIQLRTAGGLMMIGSVVVATFTTASAPNPIIGDYRNID